MILITTAMMAEARPIIKALDLKCIDKGANLYQNKDFVLTVTGVGIANCAANTGWAFGRYSDVTGAVNIGIAGSRNRKRGEVIIADTVLQASTGHIFVPDTLYVTPFAGARVVTCDSPELNGKSGEAYDMEAYGFVRAAYPHLTTDKIAVVKIISDGADEEVSAITANDVTALVEANIDNIVGFVRSFAEYCSEKKFTVDTSFHEQRIAEAFRLTVSQREILKKELMNCAVYYGTLPDVSRLIPQPETKKKENAKAFEAFIDRMRKNEDCIPVEISNPVLPKRRFFDRIYVEDEVLNHPSTQRVTQRFKDASVIRIPHYKSVFNVGRQNIVAQKYRKNLILAKATGQLVYKGSDYCNAFGFDKFYYCSTVMGCAYGCEYCYLAGIYNSANIVAFVNTEDFFAELERECGDEPSLVCCSYDSDIIALDGVLDTVGAWLDFAKNHQNITLEIRTKSGNLAAFDREPIPNVIIAYTVSPDKVSDSYEPSSPPLRARLSAARRLSDAGWRVRLCMEPILYPVVKIEEYFALADEIAQDAVQRRYEDVVVGEFRMNRQCFAKIAELLLHSKLFHNPFHYNDGTFVSYNGASEAVKMISERIRMNCDVKVVEFEYSADNKEHT